MFYNSHKIVFLNHILLFSFVCFSLASSVLCLKYCGQTGCETVDHAALRMTTFRCCKMCCTFCYNEFFSLAAAFYILTSDVNKEFGCRFFFAEQFMAHNVPANVRCWALTIAHFTCYVLVFANAYFRMVLSRTCSRSFSTIVSSCMGH